MKIIKEIESYPPTSEEVALTIGFFDGVHLGHLVLLNELKKKERRAVLTFSNHPLEVLQPGVKVPLLCTLEHKLSLLAQAKVDDVILLSFTSQVREKSPKEFLTNLKEHCPFTTLILGSDAKLGKNREGDKEHLQTLAKSLSFDLRYLEEVRIDNLKVSSRTIRQLITQGELKKASALLGRPYSIYTKPKQGAGFGKKIGFPTLNLSVEGLCLPPLGVYTVQVLVKGEKIPAIANLGVAPTVRQDNTPTLEVHLLNYPKEIESEFIEVILEKYIRPEKKFNSVDELKKQIAADIKKLSD